MTSLPTTAAASLADGSPAADGVSTTSPASRGAPPAGDGAPGADASAKPAPQGPSPDSTAPTARAWLVPVAAGLLVVALYAASWSRPPWMPSSTVLSRWLLCTTAIGAFLALLGVAKFGRAGGILITQLNVMSLSRLQMALWTTLVLGFYSAAVFDRLADLHSTHALSVAISGDIWGLLGISSAALVGSPLLLSMRRDKAPSAMDDVVNKTAAQLKEAPADVMGNAQGPLYANGSPKQARLSDIFEGDELSNTYMIDLAKVQMFVFTVVCAVVWVIASVEFLSSAAVLADGAALPSLPDGMVTLLGVSNAGYLANKLVAHTPTQ